jgi:hypothetical protein
MYFLPIEKKLSYARLSTTGEVLQHEDELRRYFQSDARQSIADKIVFDKVEINKREPGIIEYRVEVYVFTPLELMQFVRKEAMQLSRSLSVLAI